MGGQNAGHRFTVATREKLSISTHPCSFTIFIGMRAKLIVSIIIFISGLGGAAKADILFLRERKLNNLVSELLAVSSISKSSQPFTFARSSDGWIFISATCKGTGTVRVILDQEARGDAMIVRAGAGDSEAMRYIIKGAHTLKVECEGEISVEKLAVKAIPEMIGIVRKGGSSRKSASIPKPGRLRIISSTGAASTIRRRSWTGSSLTNSSSTGLFQNGPR
jgi:hypothetical protein